MEKNPFINTLRSYMHRVKRGKMKAPLNVMTKKMREKKSQQKWRRKNPNDIKLNFMRVNYFL